MSNVALILLFNHRYDKNIPILDEIYKNRFSNIYYLVPFYDGDQENVIPVYGKSIFFESYIADGYRSFYKKEYRHYLIVADDMMIHPAINENNYMEYFSVKDGESFIPHMMPLQDIKEKWLGTLSSMFYLKKQKYTESEQELPPYKIAVEKLKAQGVEVVPLTRRQIFGKHHYMFKYLADKAFLLARIGTRIRYPFKNKYSLPYPMVGSYSDIALIAADDIKKFCHYCGVFGATYLFAEVAVPTALALAANKKIITEKVSRRKGRSFWHGPNVWCDYKTEGYDWTDIDKKFKNLDDMFNQFPDEWIYIHPVKLSKWMKK